jgi:hypothetical protein
LSFLTFGPCSSLITILPWSADTTIPDCYVAATYVRLTDGTEKEFPSGVDLIVSTLGTDQSPIPWPRVADDEIAVADKMADTDDDQPAE